MEQQLFCKSLIFKNFTQLLQRIHLYLSNTLAGHAEFTPHIFERCPFVVVETETPHQHFALLFFELIHPYLEENEELFGISIREDLLTVGGRHRNPTDIYRKVVPVRKI